MKSVEFSCLMWDKASGSLANEFQSAFFEEIVKCFSLANIETVDASDVVEALADDGLDGVIRLIPSDIELDILDEKLSTLIKSASGDVIKEYRSKIYKKCISLSRLSIGSETELKKLADQYLADLYIRTNDGSRPAKDMMPVCEEIGKSKLVREVSRRSEALSAIFRMPSLDGILVNHYGSVFSGVRQLMASACDP